jgi:integrase
MDFVARRLIVRRQLIRRQTLSCQWSGAGHKVACAWREPETATGSRAVEMESRRPRCSGAAVVPVDVVSKRLGHSSISVTADIYGHPLEGVGHLAAEAAAALVPRSRPSYA